MRLRIVSVRLRLTLAFAAALTLILALLSGGTWLLVRLTLEHQIGEDLAARTEVLTNVIQANRDTGSLWHEVRDLEGNEIIPLFRISRNDRPFYVSDDWRRSGLDSTLAAARGDSTWVWESTDGRRYILHTVAEIHNRTRNSFTVVVAEDGERVLALLRSLGLLMLGALVLGLVLSVGGGYLLTGRLLAPVGKMASAAEVITARSLSERLPVHDPGDEFGRLATVFNQVLARLETSFTQLRRFTSDVSHALRTPLTVQRTTGELRLQGSGDVAAYRETIGSLLEETDRLRDLVENLLALARAEAGDVERKEESFGLGGLAEEVVESLAVLAEEKSQDLAAEVGEELVVAADRGMIRHALINLLDNAIRHTPPGSHIRIVTRLSADGSPAVEVRDDGPGIPPQDQERIFERFQRLDVQGEEESGAGLGLSIARWIVHLNGGCIQVESSSGQGSTFRIVLPCR